MSFISTVCQRGVSDINIRETGLNEPVVEALLQLSAEWEAENNCRGYRKNEYSDLEGSRVFLAEEDGKIIGYLSGRTVVSKRETSVMPQGTVFFEVEELYVKPACRSRGVGSALFCYVEEQVKQEASYLILSAAAKNFQAVLHFYIDELGMEFWSARLFKKL